MMRLLRVVAIISVIAAAIAIGGRSDGGANLALRAIRWFLGLDEADEFAIPL